MVISIKEILAVKPYYNIALLLMINKDMPHHAMKILGERNAFDQYKEAQDWANVLRAGNHLDYPMGLNLSNEILRPYYHVTACILAGCKDTTYMLCNEPTPNFDEKWLGDYPQATKIIEFYKKIPELYQL